MDQVELSPELADKIKTAHSAINLITGFAIFIALFGGLKLATLEPDDFFEIFLTIFPGISIVALISGKLVKLSLADRKIWKQLTVWLYIGVWLLIPPLGTGAAIMILLAQISWKKSQDTAASPE